MNIGELFVSLGINADDAAVIKFSTAISAVNTSLMVCKDMAMSAYRALDSFIDRTIEGVTALTNFEQQTDLSAQRLQKWQVAGQLSNIGMTADAVTQNVKNLQAHLTEIQLGGGNAAPFMLLGIDNYVNKDAFQILDELRTHIEDINSPTTVNLLQQMGLTPDFINVLRLSDTEFGNLSRSMQGYLLNADQMKDSLKLGTELTEIKMKIGGINDLIVSQLAPVLNPLLDKISRWLDENKQKITDFAASLSNGIKQIASNKTFKELSKDLFDVFKILMDILKQVGILFSYVWKLGIIQAFVKAIEAALLIVDGVLQAINKSIDYIIKGLKEAKSLMTKENVQKVFGKSIDLQYDLTKMLPLAPATIIPKLAASSIANFSPTNNVNIYANGQNGQELASEFGKEIQTQNNIAFSQLNNFGR